MNEFIWNLKCLYSSYFLLKKHKCEQNQNQYNWYLYLVKHDIKQFFKIFYNKNSGLPF